MTRVKGNGYTCKEGNSVKIALPPSVKGVFYELKQVISFSVESIHYRKGKGLSAHECKQEVTKIIWLANSR